MNKTQIGVILFFVAVCLWLINNTSKETISILDVVKANDTSKVYELLNKGVNPNKYECVCPPGSCGIVAGCGKSVNTLYYSVRNNNYDITKALIDRGVDIHHSSELSEYIIKYKNKKMIDLFIENGFDKKEFIFAAAKYGDADIFAYILKQFNNIENIKETNKMNLLQLASASCNVEVVKYILDNNIIEVNIKDNEGKTALHYASSCNNTEVIKLLIDAGADIDAQDKKGETPMLLTIYNSNFANFRYLLDEGADPYIIANNGDSVDFLLNYSKEGDKVIQRIRYYYLGGKV